MKKKQLLFQVILIIHKGHIDLFQKSKNCGDSLFVILNNDFQRNLKGSKEFMLEDERS